MNDNNQQPNQGFDWTRLFPLAGGIGAGIGLYNTVKGLGKPYQQAGDVLQNYYNQAQGQMGTYEGSFRDPVALQNQWVQSYQQSPYAQQLLAQSKEQGMNLAQSMGLGGSSAALRGMTAEAGNIINQDRQQYLNDLMQKYMAGADLATKMSQQTMGMGESMAGLKYGEKSAPSNAIMQLLNTAIGAVAGGLTGGFGR